MCKRFTEMLAVKGSAVEILESMLEETSMKTDLVIRGVLGTLDRAALLNTMTYFHEMQSVPMVKLVKMDDDARRGMFRAYHIHVILNESSIDDDQVRGEHKLCTLLNNCMYIYTTYL